MKSRRSRASRAWACSRAGAPPCWSIAPAGMDVSRWPFVNDAEEQFYFKPEAGSLFLSPADETPVEPSDVQPDEWDVAAAVERVEAVTTLRIARLKARWAGLRTFAPDRTPVAGFSDEGSGFFWLAGQGGYGIQTAPALSRAAAALILGSAAPRGFAGLERTRARPRSRRGALRASRSRG